MSDDTVKKYTKKDFTSDRDVKWCPGCGDYAILATVQRVMADLGNDKENQVVVSGIGCSSRFPVYMDTYGFHTLHGRAPTVATGIKVANPELDVWLVTGDGDGLSIGGNHLLHVFRRNVNIVILLFNNRIYGLTKGQYSPTSETDKVTKSTPYGSVDEPVNPVQFALAAGATFVARTYDINPKHMAEIFKAAQQHQGVAFVEILQNCVIFNDGAFNDIVDRKVRSDSTLELKEGEPMTFGDDGDKCITFEGFEPVVKKTADVKPEEIAVHKAGDSLTQSQVLAQFSSELPTPMGIIRQIQRPVYEDAVNEQVKSVKQAKGDGDLNSLLRGDSHWDVE